MSFGYRLSLIKKGFGQKKKNNNKQNKQKLNSINLNLMNLSQNQINKTGKNFARIFKVLNIIMENLFLQMTSLFVSYQLDNDVQLVVIKESLLKKLLMVQNINFHLHFQEEVQIPLLADVFWIVSYFLIQFIFMIFCNGLLNQDIFGLKDIFSINYIKIKNKKITILNGFQLFPQYQDEFTDENFKEECIKYKFDNSITLTVNLFQNQLETRDGYKIAQYKSSKNIKEIVDAKVIINNKELILIDIKDPSKFLEDPYSKIMFWKQLPRLRIQ